MKFHWVLVYASALSWAVSAASQTPAAKPSRLTELVPIIDDRGNGDAEVVLSVDLDANGTVAKAALVSGPEKFYSLAEKVARMFPHQELAGTSGVTQHVYFRKNRDQMNQPDPVYPPIAKMARVSGVVELIGSAGLDGHVTQLKGVYGHPLLQVSSIDAVRHWKYPPLTRNGVPTTFYFVTDLAYSVFSLAH